MSALFNNFTIVTVLLESIDHGTFYYAFVSSIAVFERINLFSRIQAP